MQGQYASDGFGGNGQAPHMVNNMDNNASALPPVGTLNDSHQSHSGHSLTGKVERTVGAMIGSSSLKAKGMQKEQYVMIPTPNTASLTQVFYREANSIKLQGAELAEAERLEREALMRRERAVAHGM